MTLAKMYARAIHRYRIASAGDKRRELQRLRAIATRCLRRDVRVRAA